MARVGYQTGIETDPNRFSWDGSEPRPLAWAVWYPVGVDAPRRPAPPDQFFDLGQVEHGGSVANAGSLPVVLLSHGTGGSPESLSWLARSLAEQGYVVIGAYHHGNTGREPYQAEGFLCWWERCLDLSVLLSRLSRVGPFAGRLDLDRVHIVGFSLGGYTALALAGACTSVDLYLQWAATAGCFAHGPREFANAADAVPALLDRSQVFRRSWARQGNSYLDERIRSVVAIAPAPTVRGFLPETVAHIRRPVTLITGEADQEAPSSECAGWLVKQNAQFRWISAGEDVGHYTFVGMPGGAVPDDIRILFEDQAGVERHTVHRLVCEEVLSALAKC